MKNIIDWMIAEKIAKNGFNASAIVNGLELWTLKTEDEQKARCKLYRDWRNAGEKSAVAFAKAKAGEPVLPKDTQPIFEGAMHSKPLWSVSYYTLSDGKATKQIRAESSAEAEKIAREKDETFDRLICPISIILEAA